MEYRCQVSDKQYKCLRTRIEEYLGRRVALLVLIIEWILLRRTFYKESLHTKKETVANGKEREEGKKERERERGREGEGIGEERRKKKNESFTWLYDTYY